MLLQFSTFPTDKGESVSKYVAEVIKIVKESGLPHHTSAMSTVIEGEWDEVMDVVKKCHQALRKHSRRVYTTIAIDDREGRKNALTEKIKSLEEKLGEKIE